MYKEEKRVGTDSSCCTVSWWEKISAYLFSGIFGGKTGAEGRWLEPAVLLILLKAPQQQFPLMEGRCSPNQDCPALRHIQIPSSGALSKLCSPTRSCLRGGAQAHGRAISQVLGLLLGLKNRHTSFLLLSAVIELKPVSALLSFPLCKELLVCMSFIPSWVKINKQVNKACNQENVLFSQPSILHFSKQFFWFIGSFYFSL